MEEKAQQGDVLSKDGKRKVGEKREEWAASMRLVDSKEKG